jgi:hypothetical protein
VLVKAVPWPSRLMLSWVMPKFHSCMDMHSLSVAPSLIATANSDTSLYFSLSHWYTLPDSQAGLEAPSVNCSLEVSDSYLNSVSLQLARH